MEKEELKQQVKKLLEEAGATNIHFSEEENRIVASFDWEKVVSFKAILDDWKYTGIQLDPTRERQYKIDFYK